MAVEKDAGRDLREQGLERERYIKDGRKEGVFTLVRQRLAYAMVRLGVSNLRIAVHLPPVRRRRKRRKFARPAAWFQYTEQKPSQERRPAARERKDYWA
jgi:hypothetical protein